MPSLTKKQKLEQKFNSTMPKKEAGVYDLNKVKVAKLASIADDFSRTHDLAVNVFRLGDDEEGAAVQANLDILNSIKNTLTDIRRIDSLNKKGNRAQYLDNYAQACNSLIETMSNQGDTNIDSVNNFKLAMLKLSILFCAIDSQKSKIDLGPKFFPTRGNMLAPSFRSKAYTDKIAELRANALVALKNFVNLYDYRGDNNAKTKAVTILKEARELPVFAMHRNYYMITGNWGKTSAQQDICDMIDQVNKGEDLALNKYKDHEPVPASDPSALLENL